MPTQSRSKKQPVSLKVVGLILSQSYQRCKVLLKKLHTHHKANFTPPEVRGLLEMDWTEYLHRLRKELGGQTWAMTRGVVVFEDGKFLGDEVHLMERFHDYVYMYKSPTEKVIHELAKEEYLAYLNKGNLMYAFFDVSVDDEYLGTMLFQLQTDLLPKTCGWFAGQCESSGKKIHYKGSTINRICKSGWFQAGRLNSHSDRVLEDESFCYKHDRRGILSLANNGPHKNHCEFFVTFNPAAWMDGHYVAFGRLVEGSSVLNRIENLPCFYESPCQRVHISDCGVAHVGAARDIHPTIRIRGITTGDPHIDVESLMDMVLERFYEVLFERLDSAVKKQIHGEWMADMLWVQIVKQLSGRFPPCSDMLDMKDRSSEQYIADRYLQGLYSIADIPDNFIKGLLASTVDAALERVGVLEIAESVVGFLIRRASPSITATSPSSLAAADSVFNFIMKQVNISILEIGKPQEEEQRPSQLFSEPLSQLTGTVGHPLSKNVSFADDTVTTSSSFSPTSSGHISRNTSAVNFILDKLLSFVVESGRPTLKNNSEEPPAVS